MSNRDQSRQDARQLLERFATQVFLDEHGDISVTLEESAYALRPIVGPINRDGVQEAAEELLAACQSYLLRLSSPVEPRLARELARDRFWAISALIYVCRDKKHAKETQLRITEGAPLAICMGDAYRIGVRLSKAVQTTQGVFSVSVKGCREIFSDAVQTSGGKMWSGLCPDCRSPNKKPARDQARALRRRLDSVFAGDTSTTYAYRLTLPQDD